jgi:hypothetical protein
MKKYTPGPWKFMPTEGDVMGKFIGNNNAVVCDFGYSTQYYPTEGKPPNDADARLIAAAPELYEACKAVELWVDRLLDGIHTNSPITEQQEQIFKLGSIARRLVRDAIAHAEEGK